MSGGISNTAHAESVVERLVVEADALIKWVEDHVHLIGPVMNAEGKAVHDLAGIKDAVFNARHLVPSSGPSTPSEPVTGPPPVNEEGKDSTGTLLPNQEPTDPNAVPNDPDAAPLP